MPGTVFELEGAPDSAGKRDWFTLLGRDKGDRGVFLGEDVQGYYDEPTESIWNSHAYQIGSTFGGIRINHRDVLFDAHITATESSSWQRNDSDWRRAWNMKKDSRLHCVTEESGRRWLDLRPFMEPKLESARDPHGQAFGTMKMACRAGNPRWQSKDYTETWVSEVDTTTLDPATGKLRTNRGYVTVGNPTDTDLWLQWTLMAAPQDKRARWILPDWSFGDDRFERGERDRGRRIAMPELMPKENVKVNTDEAEEQVASDLDTEIWMRMNGVQFLYCVPAYTDPVQLPVEVSNAPAGVGVQVRARRQWSRPWGLEK